MKSKYQIIDSYQTANIYCSSQVSVHILMLTFTYRADYLTEKYEEQIAALKQELLGDMDTRVGKLEATNAVLRDKLDDKKDECQSLETKITQLKNDLSLKTKRIADLEADSTSKDNLVSFSCHRHFLQTFFSSLLKQKRAQQELERVKNEYEVKIEEIELDNARRLEELEDELDQFETDNNELKTRLQELERDYSEVSSSYDRDKALWEDRFDFLENQKNQAKKDLQDAHQKFEMTVEQLQRKDSSERGKNESAQMLVLSSMEKKYKDQINDLKESHQQTIQELNIKYKQLDKDYRELKEKYELGKIYSQNFSD